MVRIQLWRVVYLIWGGTVKLWSEIIGLLPGPLPRNADELQ